MSWKSLLSLICVKSLTVAVLEASGNIPLTFRDPDMSLGTLKFSALLFGMLKMLRYKGRRHPAFAGRLAEKNFTAQIRTFDGDVGRWFSFRDESIDSGSGLHPDPQITISIASAELGARRIEDDGP